MADDCEARAASVCLDKSARCGEKIAAARKACRAKNPPNAADGILATTFSLNGDGRGKSSTNTYTNPLFDGADPGVIKVGNTWYAYVTMNAVSSSKDLKTWTPPQGQPLSAPSGWAPEVYALGGGALGGKFYNVYSGTREGEPNPGPNTSHAVFVDVADGPNGPWKRWSGPLLPWGWIDGHIFRDDDGKMYMYASWPGTHGVNVWDLAPDLKSASKTAVFCFDHKSHPIPQHTEPVTEGPYVLKRKGWYYLTASMNACCTGTQYGLRYVVSKSPKGPWTDPTKVPLLWKNGDVVGVGHHSFGVGPNGGLFAMYHAQKVPGTDNREVFISKARFEADPNGGPDVLKIDPPVRGKALAVP